MTHIDAYFDKDKTKNALVAWALSEFGIVQQPELEQLIYRGFTKIIRFESAARNKNLFDQTAGFMLEESAVWVLSGPSLYTYKLTKEPCKNWERYESHPLVKDQKDMHNWIQLMESQRIDVCVDLIRKVTASAAGIDIGQVTQDQIKQFGPTFIYNGMKIQNAAIKRVLIDENSILPEEKVYMFHEFKDDFGQWNEIQNTKDQVISFHLPAHLKVNNLVVITHGVHMARLAYILQYHSEWISETLKVYGLPLPTPKRYISNYIQMEMMGIIKNWRKKRHASKKPFSIRLITDSSP